MGKRIRGLRLTAVVICLVLFLPLWLGAAGEEKHPFFFFVITDTQLGMYDHDQDLSREQENLQKLVATANRLHPAFIVNCGDLVNKAGDAREIDAYKKIMAQLDPKIPVYNVAGNHDVRNEPTPETLKAYRGTFGRDYYTFTYQGFEGIVLDTSLIKESGRAPEEAKEQSAWLETTLNEAKGEAGKEVVVFQHIPWFLRDVDEADNYSNLPLTMRKEYLQRFRRANVHYIFAGHFHDSAVGKENGIEMRTVSALGKPLGKVESGFGIVVVKEHQLKFTYYPIDAPPAEVKIQ